MRKECVSGKVDNTCGRISMKALFSQNNVVDARQIKNKTVQVGGVYLRTGRNIESVLKIRMKRLC